MIGKILILATVAVANARHVLEPERATVSSDRCKPGIHHLLPHEWDCTKFYYCEYGEKWVTPRDCAPGTEFSYELQIFLLLPHHEDCNKFYTCDHGKEVQVVCPSETIFDFVEQGCNWSWATSCVLRKREDDSSSEESVEGSGDSSEELWHPKPKDNGHVGLMHLLSEAAVKPSEAHAFSTILDCENSESAARRLPYRGDCQRYWRCSNGVPEAIFCSDGLFFNERTQQCDLEANSKCTDVQHNELGGEFIEYK
ncbi:probable chitinase 10 isoform X2 [Leguminivora glycinivorella]|uniref:probable chitinase 10 isoform X2 n=1 Tax=Leguminivora glycinivorella TaxID=1035111 RepID=UPI00200CAA34|nr:probable chitinase 10 isoform X2 [Leguminivora glycinivorella]